jgi:hypothetical protein
MYPNTTPSFVTHSLGSPCSMAALSCFTFAKTIALLPVPLESSDNNPERKNMNRKVSRKPVTTALSWLSWT